MFAAASCQLLEHRDAVLPAFGLQERRGEGEREGEASVFFCGLKKSLGQVQCEFDFVRLCPLP
jgi:hypothetical protein